VLSLVAGAILSVAFFEGARVKQCDRLFTIDSAPYQASVAQAQGQGASAEAKVSLAQTELDRGRRLSDNRTIAQSDLD
ncbi:biotin/lipoyl-binding protein, partial [Rhizobium ruizarguesonis]